MKKVNTGGGAYVEGNVNINGKGRFIGRDSYEIDTNFERKQVFQLIYDAIDRSSTLSKVDKSDIKQEVDDICQELKKSGEPDEGFLMRRLRNIGRIAPDILEVVLSTIISPAAGFGMVAKKVAKKMKASAG